MNYQQPRIASSAYVAKETVMHGDITIGERATVLHFTSMRAEEGAKIVIGEDTNVQEHCTLHTDEGCDIIVGSGVTIGHQCLLHGCEVKDGAMVGMGSIVMDDAVIGKGSFVGAGSLVTQGMEIPDGMLAIGRPAKVVRPVTEKEKQYIRDSVPEYQHVGRLLREDDQELQEE